MRPMEAVTVCEPLADALTSAQARNALWCNRIHMSAVLQCALGVQGDN